VSKNFAMTLGGLEQGVTPLDMAHAYQTFAQNGRFTYSTMSPGAVDRRKLGIPTPGPAGIKVIGRKDDGKVKPIELPDGTKAESKPVSWPVLKSSVAGSVSSMLSQVVAQGTATRAQIPGVFVAGKTGTTENYGDAWFVGWTDKITVAVWVGYPDELRPMETEFNGEPVAGGTYPAAIWKSFVEAARRYDEYGGEDEDSDEENGETTTPVTPTTPGTTAPAPETPAPAPETSVPESAPAPQEAAPAPEPEPEQPADTAPEPAPPAQQPPAQQGAPESGGAAPPQ
jgi:penicillin-binding protein 1A